MWSKKGSTGAIACQTVWTGCSKPLAPDLAPGAFGPFWPLLCPVGAVGAVGVVGAVGHVCLVRYVIPVVHVGYLYHLYGYCGCINHVHTWGGVIVLVYWGGSCEESVMVCKTVVTIKVSEGELTCW